MGDSSSVLGEAADGVRTLFSRLGEFFHIFDLSFFVAGTSTVGALLTLRWRLGWPNLTVSGWSVGLGLVIGCYICGLVTFSLGRTLNGMFFRRRVLRGLLHGALVSQQLEGSLIEKYRQAEAPDGFPLWRLYIRLWQQLAEKHPRSVAFGHLSRYWAMAATYDGVAASFLIWATVLLPVTWLGTLALGLWQSVFSMAVLLAASVLCFMQGGKYYEFQVEDLVAALAVMKSNID